MDSPKKCSKPISLRSKGFRIYNRGIASYKSSVRRKDFHFDERDRSATNTTTVSETVNVVTGANVGLVNNQSGWTAYTTSADRLRLVYHPQRFLAYRGDT